MRARTIAIVVLALAGASLGGMAMASGAPRLWLGALAIASAGAFGGLVDAEGRAPRRTIMLLGALTYLVLVPVLGFVGRGLDELGSSSRAWWISAALAVAGLPAAFFATRRWWHERAGHATGPALAPNAALTR
jgi:hypothetical protein